MAGFRAFWLRASSRRLGSERLRNLVDRPALRVADRLAAFPVGVCDLVGQREDELPVVLDLLGCRLLREHGDGVAEMLQACLPELFRGVVARVVALGLRGDDLVEQLAGAVVFARLDVRLGHRDRLAKAPASLRRDDDQPRARRPLEDQRPLVGREVGLARHGYSPPLPACGLKYRCTSWNWASGRPAIPTASKFGESRSSKKLCQSCCDSQTSTIPIVSPSHHTTWKIPPCAGSPSQSTSSRRWSYCSFVGPDHFNVNTTAMPVLLSGGSGASSHVANESSGRASVEATHGNVPDSSRFLGAVPVSRRDDHHVPDLLRDPRRPGRARLRTGV